MGVAAHPRQGGQGLQGQLLRPAPCGQLSQMGFYLLWTKEHPKQRNVRVSLHSYHRAEGSGLGVSLCGNEEGTAVKETQRGWTDPGSWCLAERCWREAQPHQPLEHFSEGPPGVLHPRASGH